MKTYEIIDNKKIQEFEKKISNFQNQTKNISASDIEFEISKKVKSNKNISEKLRELSKEFSQIDNIISDDRIKFEEKIINIKDVIGRITDPKKKGRCFSLFKSIKNSFAQIEKEAKKDSISIEKKKENSKNQSKISKLRIGDNKFQNLKSHSNDLTSFARLLQMNFFKNEPCVALFYDKEKNTLFYSTNKNSDLINTKNWKTPSRLPIIFFQKVAERLSKCNEINKAEGDENIKKIISIRDDYFDNKDKIDTNEGISKIIEYCNDIIKIQNNKSFTSYLGVKNALCESAIYSHDILVIYDILNENKPSVNRHSFSKNISDQNLLNKIKKFDIQKLKFTTQNDKDFDVHCECKILEHLFIAQDPWLNLELEQIFEKFAENVESKNITVSKFCCLFCYLVFSGIGKNFDKEDIFRKLGNSGLVFLNWKSPTIENKNKKWDSPLEKLKKNIEGSLEEALERSFNNYKDAFNSESEQRLIVIENSVLAENL